ncbi:NUDIX hydrolase [Hazenella coriacea]|uniref:Isopentenyldiphosphate isomerase n=1 Tax=Hazenella coriacea TaxID=1179467 RepID=A0A4R3L4H5_9BACL|nr:NUDIX domain-containing protein [Hazenella coriacea]TCS93868.1 isopentenyldiphosphate isomerase [Hazenella coriacea]
MESEAIKIFDEYRNEVGVATRKKAHQVGHWHETFHCWFINREEGMNYIYFQLRSETKKDFPNLLDITAAGHILANENVSDGIREVKEELGIALSDHELVSLGVIKDCIISKDFIDREFCNVFLYESNKKMNEYKLQREEVSGIFKVPFDEFCELWLGDVEEITVEGFQVSYDGHKVVLNMNVNKSNFVPHENAYYERLLALIRKRFEIYSNQ